LGLGHARRGRVRRVRAPRRRGRGDRVRESVFKVRRVLNTFRFSPTTRFQHLIAWVPSFQLTDRSFRTERLGSRRRTNHLGMDGFAMQARPRPRSVSHWSPYDRVRVVNAVP
jgi:hypothetical protein